MGVQKTAAIEQVLGEPQILDDSTDELMPYFVHANQEMLTEVGGEAAWKSPWWTYTEGIKICDASKAHNWFR